jgi:hypothetical protein
MERCEADATYDSGNEIELSGARLTEKGLLTSQATKSEVLPSQWRKT